MTEKSFQLLRTNPALTTNVKLVVTSQYKLYLESFDSNKSLSTDKYKHFSLNKENYYEDKLPVFYDGLAANIAYEVKYNQDATLMQSSYIKQFDDSYFAGGKNIKDQWYTEEFEYLAPLYIKKNSIPEGFVILRVDGPAVYLESDDNYSLGTLTRENFRSEIVDKWKVVQLFDMTYQSDFGYWLYKNYTNNERFPDVPFEFDSKSYNFSRWHGIDYETGVFTYRDYFIQDRMFLESQHFDFEKFISEAYLNNKLVYPNILNIKFLYDDTPATPFNIKKYSLNRYYGFYVDKLELITNLTSYVPHTLLSNVDIINNIFVISGTTTGATCPFSEWSTKEKYFIYAKKDLHEVVKVIEDNVSYWKVISNDLLTISDIDNSGVVTIEFSNTGSTYINKIVGLNTNFRIDPFIHCDGTYDCLYGDLYLILIDGKYHTIKATNINNNCIYYIDTDYAINSDFNNLEYWIDDKNTNYKKISILTQETPLTYPVYRIKFSDIKDWDYDRVHSKFADFDYEKTDYYHTNEHKLYAEEYRDKSIPRDFKVEKVGTTAQYQILNTSSEYVADDELFLLDKNSNLTDIWRKNQSVPKWGFMGSNSHCDYPYKLNNSNRIGSTYNKTTDPFLIYPDEVSKNLDYLYRIGQFHSDGSVIRYLNQTTNIETNLMNSDSYKFNLDNYIKSEVDYFDYFFRNKMVYEENQNIGVKKTEKYSLFVGGSEFNNSYTLFKGLKIHALSINSVTKDEQNKIASITSDYTKNYNDYKFSAIVNFCYQFYKCEQLLAEDERAGSFSCTATTTITANTIYELYQPQYLETINWNLQFDGVKGYEKTNYTTCSSSYDTNKGLLNIVLSPNLFVPKTTTKKLKETILYSISDIKDYSNYYVVFSATAVTASTSYSFTGYTTDNDLVRFSGHTTYLDTNTSGHTYTFSAGTETIVVSLKNIFNSNCDLNNFFQLLNNSGSYWKIYEDYECCYNGSIIDTNNIISNCNNAVHIFLNDKHKNILALVNIRVPIWNSVDGGFKDLNNIKYFSEKHGFYYGKTTDGIYVLPSRDAEYKSYLLTAGKFISLINNFNQEDFGGFDKNITYHYINESGEYGYYIVNSSSTLRNISTWNNDFSPMLLNVEYPELIDVKKNSYVTQPVKGPKSNIYELYKKTENEPPITEPLARMTTVNVNEPSANVSSYGMTNTPTIPPVNSISITPSATVAPLSQGSTASPTKQIYRFNGYYEPIFKDIELFNSYDYCYINNSVFSQTFYPSFIEQTGTSVFSWTGIDVYDGCYGKYIGFNGEHGVLSNKLMFHFDFSTLPNNYIVRGIEIYYSCLQSGAAPPDISSRDFYSGSHPVDNTNAPTFESINVYGSKTSAFGISQIDLANLVNNPVGATFDVIAKSKNGTGYIGISCVFMKIYYTISGVTIPDNYINSISRNYKFDTTLTKFGMIDELIYSKVNPTENVLKLKNSKQDKSVYPMIDEYGYQFGSRFIFKSTWDNDYYVLTKNNIK